MLEDKECVLDCFYNTIGKVVVFSVVCCSIIALTAAFCEKDQYGLKYQERLRRAYEGLSPEEY
jgi:hypothetical protein